MAGISPFLPMTKDSTTKMNELSAIQTNLRHIWADLLGIPANTIETTDNFHSLGGDSLMLQRLFFQLSRSFSGNFSLASIFQHKTLETLASYIMNGRDSCAMIPLTIGQDQPISFAQERLVFISEYDTGNVAYNVPMHMEIGKLVDKEILKMALFSMICRHEIMRTILVKKKGGYGHVQHVLSEDQAKLMFKIEEFCVRDKSDLDQKMMEASEYIFHLDSEFPIKVTMYKSKSEIFMTINIHHIAFDGWSWTVFQNDLEAFYQFHYFGTKIPLNLPHLPVQYKDFSTWQRKMLNSSKMQGLLDYWKEKLEKFESLHLITDFPRPSQFDYSGMDILFELDKETTDQLKSEAMHLNVSLFSLLLGAYCFSLGNYSNQKDILIGTPVANRNRPELENMIGFFINMLPIRVKIDYELSIGDYIRMVSDEVIKAQIHQEMPFEKLVKEIEETKDLSRHPIFQVMFAMDPFEVNSKINQSIGLDRNDFCVSIASNHRGWTDTFKSIKSDISDSIKSIKPDTSNSNNFIKSDHLINSIISIKSDHSNSIKSISSDHDQSGKLHLIGYHPDQSDHTYSKYDLSTSITETDTGLRGIFNFCSKLFTKKTIQGYLDSYKHILKQFAKSDLKLKLENIELVDRKLIEPFLDSKINTDQPVIKTLHQIFEEEVLKSAYKIAIAYKDMQLTYKELNYRSNQLANYLRSQKSIEPDSLIALLLDKTESMVISILGVWKSGAAYVPIDPTYPDDRIQFILRDTKAKIMITNRQYAGRIKDRSILIIEIDHPSIIDQLKEQSVENLEGNTGVENLAYVIYTSGTTGRPKGVLVEHGSVVNLRNDLVDRFFGTQNTSDQQEGILFLCNYVFDVSLEQIILSILCSNKLILFDSDQPFDDRFYHYSNIHGLTYVSGTPTYVLQMNLSRLCHLRRVTVAGEAFTKNHFDKIRGQFGGIVINAFGITETTVYNTVDIYQKDDSFRNSLGVLLNNSKQFVLNENLQLLPIGAIGELYLVGDCVTRGYLDQPDLTNQRYLLNRYQTEHEKSMGRFDRLYKTGDLVRINQDGQLEYHGRNDQQIKIHGARIDLREIEVVLSSCEGVRQCAVLPINRHHNPNGIHDCLIGYYVSEGNKTLDQEVMANIFQKILPTYMIPARFIRVDDKLPITINGKLNIGALPKVDFVSDKDGFAAPRTQLEAKICQIWSYLLNMEDIGIDDDFFRLGGDSIMSQQACGLIRHDLKVTIALKDIFVHRTIRKLSDNVLSRQQIKMEMVTEQGILTGSLPLLPIQAWFFGKDLKNAHFWNQSFMIKTEALDLEKLKESLTKLIDHHDAFRLRFKKEKSEWMQFYDPHYHNGQSDLKIFDIQSGQNLRDTLTEWQSGFNLENGPLQHVAYLHGFEDGSSLVWFAMHHLIVDSVSWRIICQDLHTIYKGGSLGAKGTSYRQWVNAVYEYGSKAENERSFWMNFCPKVEEFNRKLEILEEESSRKSQVLFSLTKEQTENLLRRCNEIYGTQINDLLLTAVAYGLQELTKNGMNFVTLEGHGREDIDSSLDITRTIGWFTCMYPVELTIGQNLQMTIQSIKNHLNTIPNKGIGYGPIIGYEKSLPRVTFNYLGQFDGNKKSWSLTNVTGEYDQDRSVDIECDHDLISIVAVTSSDQMRFNVETRISPDATDRFSAIFKSKLEEIASGIDSDHLADSIDFEPYVEFSGPNKDHILFMLPPGKGGAESYFNNLVQHLTSFRLILFNNYFLHKSDMTFEELAKFYMVYIRHIQSKGPYNFLGWSFGGVLSLEIARQLVQDGEIVQNLIIIDSYFNLPIGSLAIGKPEEYVVDKIHYLYAKSKKAEDFENLASSVRNIVMFHGKKLNDIYDTEDEMRLYEYYRHTECNDLDTLIDRRLIWVIDMEEDNHSTWVWNKKQLGDMEELISGLFRGV